MATRAAVDSFVSQPALALVGASRSGKKFGNYACRELLKKGYRVYPIHPSAESIEGVQSYRHFSDLPEHVEAVLVIVPPAKAGDVVREAAHAGIHRVWLQQGASSPDVLAVCREVGVEAIAGECILMFANPTSFHKVHRWAWKLLGKMPS